MSQQNNPIDAIQSEDYNQNQIISLSQRDKDDGESEQASLTMQDRLEID